MFSTALNLYDNDNKTFLRPTTSLRKQLLGELCEKYPGVLSITIVTPFIFIECDPLPEPETTPFLVAGCVAKFLGPDETYPIGSSFMGDPGQAIVDDITEDITSDLRTFSNPISEDVRVLIQNYPMRQAHNFLSPSTPRRTRDYGPLRLSRCTAYTPGPCRRIKRGLH
jgi:hypothetical protein